MELSPGIPKAQTALPAPVSKGEGRDMFGIQGKRAPSLRVAGYMAACREGAGGGQSVLAACSAFADSNSYMSQLAEAVSPSRRPPKISVWTPPTSARYRMKMRNAMIAKTQFRKIHMP
eukprot:EG_transcript_42309